MEKEKKSKVIFKEDVKCPFCKKMIEIKKTKKLIEEGTPAEYQEKLVVSKSEQTKL